MDMLNKELEESLEKVISVITESKEYKKCIELKEQMKDNKKINQLVSEVKSLQKKYIREKDLSIKEILNQKEKELNEIPIYHEYNQNLLMVNDKITLVREELNDYFNHKLN